MALYYCFVEQTDDSVGEKAPDDELRSNTGYNLRV